MNSKNNCIRTARTGLVLISVIVLSTSLSAQVLRPTQTARFDRWRVLYDFGVVPSYIDPYNQNPIKGDFPVFGNNTFLVLTGLYTPKAVLTSQENVDTQFNNDVLTSFELFKGTTVFEPKRWSLKATGKGIFNRGNNDVDDFAFLEAFGELKLFEVGEHFDFTSVRGGLQFFRSDFNGFVFQDFNLGGQLFGELNQNRNQWSVAYLSLRRKENGLLTFDELNQEVFFANWFIEDFLRPGFNTVFSVHINRDRQLTDLDVTYVGVATDGHWGRIEFNPTLYFAFGSQDDIDGNSLDVSAFLAGVEIAYPKDYLNYRGAVFVASGDSDPLDDKANGFDSINDNINLFGAGNSFVIGGGEFGTRANSFIPSVRSIGTKSNFVNPGMLLANLGLDITVTPKLFFTSNLNYFQFLQQEVVGLESKSLGFEVNGAVNHRIFLNENLVFQLGVNAFFPQSAAEEILGNKDLILTGNVALVTLF